MCLTVHHFHTLSATKVRLFPHPTKLFTNFSPFPPPFPSKFPYPLPFPSPLNPARGVRGSSPPLEGEGLGVGSPHSSLFILHSGVGSSHSSLFTLHSSFRGGVSHSPHWAYWAHPIPLPLGGRPGGGFWWQAGKGLQKKPPHPAMQRLSQIKRRLPTLPRVCSTIGAGGLNFSVRNGKRWNPATITT